MSDIVFSDELRDMLKTGKSVRIVYNPNNPNNRLHHIRAVVDDDYIVYRFWSRSKGWIYGVEWIYFYYLLHRNGNLSSK